MNCDCPKCTEFKHGAMSELVEMILANYNLDPIVRGALRMDMHRIIVEARKPWHKPEDMAMDVFKRTHPGERETSYIYNEILGAIKYAFDRAWR